MKPICNDKTVAHVKFFVGKAELDAIKNAMKRLGLEQGDVMRLFVKIGASMVPVLERVRSDDGTDREKGYLEQCFFCNGAWGKCTCPPLPECDDPKAEEGFSWGGLWISDPSLSSCTRFFVDPVAYYGEAYTNWKDRKAFERSRKPSRKRVRKGG